MSRARGTRGPASSTADASTRGARRRPPAGGREGHALAGAMDRVPGWIGPVLLALLTLWTFRAFVFSREMLFGMDTLTLGYQARVFFADALRSTGFPLWNPHILGGTPFLESLAGGDALHPLSVALFYLVEPYRALGWKLVIHVFLAGIFTLGWMRTLGVSRGGALVAATGALLAPSFVTLVYPGHDGKMFVVAMAPLLFWLAEWMWRRKDLVPGALLALSIGTVILSTHFQMAYFLFGALGAWMAFRAIQVGRREGAMVAVRGFSIFLGFSILGAGTAAIQLLPAVEYVTEHSRRAATTVAAESPQAARDYSASWSLHPEEAMSLLVPEFVGNSAGGAEWTTDTYWGRNAFKLNHEYLGVVLLALALLAFLPLGKGAAPDRRSPRGPPQPRNNDAAASEARTEATGGRAGGDEGAHLPLGTRIFLGALGGTALLFALGAHTPVWRIFYEVVPGISLFRAPSQAIFLAAFATCTLAGIGVDRGVAALQDGDARRRLLQWLGALAGLLLLGGVLAASGVLLDLWNAVLYREMAPDRAFALGRLEPFLVRGFFLAALLVGMVLGAFLLALRAGSAGAPLLVAALVLLVFLDLARVNAPFIQVIDPTRVTVPDANHRFLLDRQAQEPPFRVFSMVQGGQDVQGSAFGLDLAAGHHPNDLGRYRELIGMEGSGIPEHLATFDPVILAILNVRYILWPEGQYGPLEGLEPVSQVTLGDGTPWVSVHPYPGLPRAWLVDRARVVEEDQTLQVILEDPGFDPRREVVLEEEPPVVPIARPDDQPHPLGAVRWIEQEPDRMVLEVEAETDALLVLSQNWFPTWSAKVGDIEAPVLRANHALQAIPLPGGTHRVEVRVDPGALRPALLLSGLSLLLVLGTGLASGLLARAHRPPGGREGESAP